MSLDKLFSKLKGGPGSGNWGHGGRPGKIEFPQNKNYSHVADVNRKNKTLEEINSFIR